jgi:hypothetical protein
MRNTVTAIAASISAIRMSAQLDIIETGKAGGAGSPAPASARTIRAE